MPQYTVQHAYRSVRDGITYGPWTCGDVVDLTEDDAAWLERDSPGVLATSTPEPAPVDEVERQQLPVRDRQARGGRNRGA